MGKASVDKTKGIEQRRFAVYGGIYVNACPEPPPLPDPNAQTLPNGDGARAGRTQSTRVAVHGKTGLSKGAPQKQQGK